MTAGLGAALLCLACSVAAPSSVSSSGAVGGDPTPPGRAFDARVDRVVDGDTFIAVRRGERLRVRLIGVDAPESVRPGYPVECWGPEASRLLARTLPVGSKVRAAYQDGGRHDRYGRELWDVWLPGGTFVQGRLVRRGAAEAVAYEPQTDHARRLDQIEARARAVDVGLWGAC
jgi:micrococcal nuclease